MAAARLTGVWFVLLVLLYVGAISSVSGIEMLVGAVGAGLAAVGALLTARAQDAHQHPPRSWPWWLLRALGEAVVDTARLVRVLALHLAGRRVASRFVRFQLPLTGHEGRDGGRRALATTALALPPCSYVVEMERDDGTVLMHVLGVDDVGLSRLVSS